MNIIRFPSILIVVVIAMMSIACSKSDSPVLPSNDATLDTSQGLPVSALSGNSNRSLLAVYDAVIDPVAKTFTVTPDNRTAQYHYPLTLLYPNVLTITNFGWTPNFWADIKLTHPLPGTGVTGYDPRVIAILPARTGVSMNYPTLDVHANNSVVLSPDGYTKLFDELAGAPGNANPFIAYFYDQPFRRWSGTGVTEETKKWQMNLSGFGGPIQFQLVVDISTNYPNPPQQIVDNVAEPYFIHAVVGEGIVEYGGSAEITVSCFDWQGRLTISNVQVESPDLFNGIVNLAYTIPGPSANSYIYVGTINNALAMPAGDYTYLVSAMDNSTGIYLYQEFLLNIPETSLDGNLIWAKRAASGIKSNYVNAISIAPDNSIIMTGEFLNSITFDTGGPNHTTLTSIGLSDVFIAKFDSEGGFLWAKNAGGLDDDAGNGVTTQSDNSIIVIGQFNSSIVFAPDEPNETVLWSIGGSDIFIAKYDSEGSFVWADYAGGWGGDDGKAVLALPDDSIYITGNFNETAVFDQYEPSQIVINSTDANHMFIARYDPDGTVLWAKGTTGSNCSGVGLTKLSDGSVVITGDHYGPITFGKGEPNEIVLPFAGECDYFVARYYVNGFFAWAKRGYGFFYDSSKGIASLSNDLIIITGTEDGIPDPFRSGSGIFISCYDSDGTLEWKKRMGQQFDSGTAISPLPDDTFIVIGDFTEEAIFGSGEPNETVLTSDSQSIFMARYNPDGTLQWARSDGVSGGTDVKTIFGNSYVTVGSFGATVILGLGEPNETTLNCGSDCIFLARYDE